MSCEASIYDGTKVLKARHTSQGCARASLALGWLVSGLWPCCTMKFRTGSGAGDLRSLMILSRCHAKAGSGAERALPEGGIIPPLLVRRDLLNVVFIP